MATSTGGTKATTTLGTGVQFPGPNGATSLADADVAAVANLILNDQDPGQIVPGAWSRMGLLYVPNRGVLKTLPGDWVFVGPDGFPYLVPAIALPTTLTATGTTNSTTAVTGLSANVIAQGWVPGMLIAGTNLTAGTTIAAIAAGGLSLTLSAAATGSGSGITFTAGSFTHS